MEKRRKTYKNANLKHLYAKIRGGHVTRYHTRPELTNGQNVAAHTWRAMVILHTLWPEASKNCLLHMMYHDVAEIAVGDLPATTKWNYSEVHSLLKRIENDFESSIGIGELFIPITVEEAKACDAADKLELVLHCYELITQGNKSAVDVMNRGIRYLKDKYPHEKQVNRALKMIIRLHNLSK